MVGLSLLCAASSRVSWHLCLGGGLTILQINIATTIGRDTSSLKLMEVSPWVIVVMGAIMLLGVVMMVIGRVSYVQELAR